MTGLVGCCKLTDPQVTMTHRCRLLWMSGLDSKWVRFTRNRTNPGLFQIRFQYILAPGPKCTEIWSEKVPDLSYFGWIWPTLNPNLTSTTDDSGVSLWPEGQLTYSTRPGPSPRTINKMGQITQHAESKQHCVYLRLREKTLLVYDMTQKTYLLVIR